MDEKTEEEREAEDESEADGHSHDDTSEFLRRPDESTTAYAARIFERVYITDIEKLVSMEVFVNTTS